MIYDISKATAPAMPYLGKGTDCIKLLLSQTSKDMREPLVPMLFPKLGEHIGDASNRIETAFFCMVFVFMMFIIRPEDKKTFLSVNKLYDF